MRPNWRPCRLMGSSETLMLFEWTGGKRCFTTVQRYKLGPEFNVWPEPLHCTVGSRGQLTAWPAWLLTDPLSKSHRIVDSVWEIQNPQWPLSVQRLVTDRSLFTIGSTTRPWLLDRLIRSYLLISHCAQHLGFRGTSILHLTDVQRPSIYILYTL